MSRPGTRARGERRRQAIVDAALTVLGRGGAGAVTHRAVAKEADVPLAATTYYFASKDELLREAFARALAEDVAALGVARLVKRGEQPTVPAVARRLAALITKRVRSEHATLLVQYELSLEAARRPELAAMCRAWTEAYVRRFAPVLAALGSTHPERDAWILATSLEGMELEALASGELDPETKLVPAVERLLGALVYGRA